MINSFPPRKVRGALVIVAMLTASAFPALLAVLPLALNGAQQLLTDSTPTHTTSAAAGSVMLMAAALPFVGGLATLGYGRARLSNDRAWGVTAAFVFITGLIACVVAMFYAA
ncbi:hypothetical protein ACF068_07235 [Streptomyces sp. NPDC016309]|uniref:hypothetical protein n=1 Tax=Streptomyces sp. NPDC016309 TaxID=3364965 RepID=UPI0036F5367B